MITIKAIKYIVSIILVVLLTFLTVVPGFAGEEKCNCDHAPVIYVIGRTSIYDDVDNPQRKLADSINTNQMIGYIKDCLPLIPKAVFLGQEKPLYDKIYSYVDEFFGNYAPNPNGEITDNSGSLFKWSEECLSKEHYNVDIYTYKFEYDSRRSPMDVADDLNDYIEAVKNKTGHDKVNIICRCVGVNYTFAYLYKYQKSVNYSGINSLVIYNSALKGVDILEALFSGTIKFDTESAGIYLNNLQFNTGDDALTQFLKQTITMLNDTYGIDIGIKLLNLAFKSLEKDYMQEFVCRTFGYTAGYWSMIYDDYEKAKDYVFGKDKSASEKLIAKIDDFHYNVQLKAERTILDMKNNGIDVNIICKYGYQAPPASAGCFKVSDDTITLERQSFGATTSEYNKTLGSSYIKARAEAGFDDYISPDLQVDASTCILPENTWFIKYYHHNNFWWELDEMLRALCYQDGIKVGTDSRFYRFSKFKSGSLPEELTKDNCFSNGEVLIDPDVSTKKTKTLFSTFKALVEYIKILIPFLQERGII